MKTDQEVLAEARELVEAGWCQRSFHKRGLDSYCSVGALQKSVGAYVGYLDSYSSLRSPHRLAQVLRVVGNLAEVIKEQYPEFYRKYCHETDVVIRFNDTHSKGEVLTIFDKAITK